MLDKIILLNTVKMINSGKEYKVDFYAYHPSRESSRRNVLAKALRKNFKKMYLYRHSINGKNAGDILLNKPFGKYNNKQLCKFVHI